VGALYIRQTELRTFYESLMQYYEREHLLESIGIECRRDWKDNTERLAGVKKIEEYP